MFSLYTSHFIASVTNQKSYQSLFFVEAEVVENGAGIHGVVRRNDSILLDNNR